MADGNDTQHNGAPAQGPTTGVLLAGTSAPDFTLKAAPDRTLSLSELRGKPVVIAFYPADWSPVCGDQMALYNEVLPDFQEQGAHLLGISVDSVWCHKAFSQARNLHFDLLADFEPKGAVSTAYGAYRAGDGFSERALFVVDANGIIQWSYLSPVGVNPGADGILNALASLTDEQRGRALGANASAVTRAPGGASEATQAGAAP